MSSRHGASMESDEESEVDPELAGEGSDYEVDRAIYLEERILKAEARKKQYIRSLQESSAGGSTRVANEPARRRHKVRTTRDKDSEDEADEILSSGSEKEFTPRRKSLISKMHIGLPANVISMFGSLRERALARVLGIALVLVVALFVVHFRQDVSYWEELEGIVRAERQAREEAQMQLARVGGASGAGGAAGQLAQLTAMPAANCPECERCQECPRCPASPDCPTVQCEACQQCESCPKCPPRDARTLAPASASDGPLEEWVPDFKVYVYDLPAEFHSDLKRDQRRCINDQYGTEIMIHENLLKHEVRTKDPAEAEFFFIPIYGECFLFRENQRAGREALKNTNKWFRKALRIVTHEHPYWNRTQGRDHVWVFAGARGPHIFQDWKKNIKKSIFMTPEGDRSLSEQFNTWKDVVIPGLENEPTYVTGQNRGTPLEKRSIFAFFRGTIHNKGGASYSKGIRIKMEEVLRSKADVVFSEPSPTCNRRCYRESMARAVYCLCPRGWSPWTLRAYQAMMSGCIPVIIADEIEFPYEHTMDWTELTVKIPEVDHLKTYDILKAIPEEEVRRKQDAIAKVWRQVAWESPTKPGDAFHAVLRELGRKKRAFKASSLTFWN